MRKNYLSYYLDLFAWTILVSVRVRCMTKNQLLRTSPVLAMQFRRLNLSEPLSNGENPHQERSRIRKDYTR